MAEARSAAKTARGVKANPDVEKVTPAPPATPSNDAGRLELAPDLALQIHRLMVRDRALEERLIRMYKQSDGFFWIGGPGEEAFNVPLGLQIRTGQGPRFDYFHGHYRSSGVLLAMGAQPVDFIRQMKSTATDPWSGGRNFAGHASIRKWNVCPIKSPIETQFAMAPGTAIANKRAAAGAITVVVGGDAGTAEGDFATCLGWSSRPGAELPLLMAVTNNRWGISTPTGTQSGDQVIADRGKAFGIRTKIVDGNDPAASYTAVAEAMDYVRREQRPFLLEAHVSRLYGHSSASGANFVPDEPDCVALHEERLLRAGVLGKAEAARIRQEAETEMAALARQVRDEPQPAADSIWDNLWAGQKGRADRFW